MAARLFLVSVHGSGPSSDDLQLFLEEHAPWGWEELEEPGGTVLRIYCTSPGQAERLSGRIVSAHPGLKTRISKQEDLDWAESWRTFFKPIRVAETFAVVPSWEQPASIGPGLLRIAIYPQMAFGTGHHPTTHLCLEVLAKLRSAGRIRPGQRCLDLGTGSGILGIAASLLGLRTLGLDTDPVAVDNAKLNRAHNKAESHLELVVGGVPSLKRGRCFDLIAANILAQPLKDLAGEIAARLAPQGSLLLSGVLRSQEEDVTQAYAAQGFGKPAAYRREDWSALLWPSV